MTAPTARQTKPSTIPEHYIRRENAANAVGKDPKTIYRLIKKAIEVDVNTIARPEDKLEAVRLKGMLYHCRLELRKGGTAIDGTEVKSMKQVDDFRRKGDGPMWWIDPIEFRNFFESQSGVVDESIQVTDSVKEENPRPAKSGKSRRDVQNSEQHLLPDNVLFLQERIEQLEKEKQGEKNRHDQLVAKLFGELDVKNKQIQSWDKVTQGLTAGLASGRIRPSTGTLFLSENSDTWEEGSNDAPKGNNPGQAEVVPEAGTIVSDGQPVTEASPTRKKQKVAKSNTAKRNKQASKTKARKKPSKQSAQKKKWYNTPISELFSR